jgi:hypothetical protein
MPQSNFHIIVFKCVLDIPYDLVCSPFAHEYLPTAFAEPQAVTNDVLDTAPIITDANGEEEEAQVEGPQQLQAVARPLPDAVNGNPEQRPPKRHRKKGPVPKFDAVKSVEQLVGHFEDGSLVGYMVRHKTITGCDSLPSNVRNHKVSQLLFSLRLWPNLGYARRVCAILWQ